MTAAAFAFSIVVCLSCNFFSYEGRADNRSGQGGLFYVTDPNSGECVEYGVVSTKLVEPVVTGARICAIIAAIFGFFALIMVLLEFCCCKIPCSRVCYTIIYLIAWICQGLTFLMWANESYW